MKLIMDENEIVQLVHHQIKNFWGGWDKGD